MAVVAIAAGAGMAGSWSLLLPARGEPGGKGNNTNRLSVTATERPHGLAQRQNKHSAGSPRAARANAAAQFPVALLAGHYSVYMAIEESQAGFLKLVRRQAPIWV